MSNPPRKVRKATTWRTSGVEVALDKINASYAVRLQVWGKHFDGVIVIDTEEAKNLAAQLITAVAEISMLK